MSASADRRIRVLMAGTWDPGFTRNRVLRRLLERAGCEVMERRVALWGERGGAVVRGGKLGVALRAAFAYPLLTARVIAAPRPDVVLVPYPGHFDVPLLRLLSRLRGAPLVFDAFLSLWDTVVADRALAGPRSPVGRLARWADRTACRTADRCLTDTPAHLRFLAELSGTDPARFRVLEVGAQEHLFRPRPDVEPDPDLVLFYGTYIPLHGMTTIVRAAKALEPEGIRVRIVGDGQERDAVDALVAELAPANLERSEPVPLERLPEEIAGAGICLGIFGTTAKADRVVPNKVYECLAVGRPVVTGDTTAVREAFDEGEVVRVPVGDPEALAEAVRRLRRDPERRERVARAGRARFRKDYGEEALAGRLRDVLEEVLGEVGGRNR